MEPLEYTILFPKRSVAKLVHVAPISSSGGISRDDVVVAIRFFSEIHRELGYQAILFSVLRNNKLYDKSGFQQDVVFILTNAFDGKQGVCFTGI